MPVLAQNKKARFDYEILETFEAGLVLFGHEVKSARGGHVSLKGSYISFRGDGLYLISSLISLYKYAGQVKDYDPNRERKLLVSKKEFGYLAGKRQEKGLTLVPIKLYTKHSFLKLEFGLARGKTQYDKRESIKKRDLDRQIRTLKKHR
jgi:SsrA-binding protein